MAILEIDVAAGSAVERELRDAEQQALFVHTDITDEGSVAAAVDRTAAELGAPTILFNCAGGSLRDDDIVTEVDMAVWDRTINLDLKGTFLCCRHIIPLMSAAGGGTVINMSSGAALRGASSAHVYTAAKGAILSLTRALAGSFAKANIRVNAICSGRVWTERITSTYGRPSAPGPFEDRQDITAQLAHYPFWAGEPEAIAAVALFLASDDSRMITGAAIAADGGRSAY